MTTSDTLDKLAAALSKAQAEARGVEKDARNQFHRYDYASAEGIIRECKAHLAAHGLAVVPRSTELVPSTIMAEVAPFVLRRGWVLTHESGQHLHLSQDWVVVPEKGRPLDKAVAAADTASLGYFLRDLLQLPRVEKGTDLDANERDNFVLTKQSAPKHHPSWSSDRKAFCAWAQEEVGGKGYEDLARWTESKGWGRPSAWAQPRREGMRAKSSEWAEECLTWLGVE
jgi:hypothetical protein